MLKTWLKNLDQNIKTQFKNYHCLPTRIYAHLHQNEMHHMRQKQNNIKRRIDEINEIDDGKINR